MSAKIPHRQFRKELVIIGSGVGLVPKPFGQRSFVLPPEAIANIAWNSKLVDTMGELMDADVASGVAILFQLEEILLAAGGNSASHAARALVNRQSVVFRQRFALLEAPFREIGGDLIAADDVQFGVGGAKVLANAG